MRESLAARFDDDFAISAPVRDKARRGAKAKRGSVVGALARGALTLALRHPGFIVTATGFAGVTVFVALNALSWQTERHPSPLFQTAARAPASLPLPPSRPGPLPAAPAPLAAPLAQPAPPPPAPVVTRTASAPARDPIGYLLRTGATSPAPAPAARPEVDATVLAAQKALAKLGNAQIKIDGMMGPATRAAIETFERERKLPVTGELGARTVRELARASGITIE